MNYEVTGRLIEIYRVEVEADSRSEAIEIAENMFECSGKYKYHVDSDAQFTAYTQEEL